MYKLTAAGPAVGLLDRGRGGRVWGYHGATSCNSTRASASSPVVGIAGAGTGYWTVAKNGAISACHVASYGSMAGRHLNRSVVGMAATPSKPATGWSPDDGGIFSFGDARFFGSTGSMRLNKPVVGMAATPTGRGYWLVASDGGVFSFGDARFFGSTGSLRLHKPVVGMAATASGRGYWLVASDGGIFTFGDAQVPRLDGREPASVARSRGMAPTPIGQRLLARRRRPVRCTPSATPAFTVAPRARTPSRSASPTTERSEFLPSLGSLHIAIPGCGC